MIDQTALGRRSARLSRRRLLTAGAAGVAVAAFPTWAAARPVAPRLVVATTLYPADNLYPEV